MALEWLKTILGAAYTPEIDTAVSQEIGKGFVARTDFNATSGKLKEAEAQVGQLTESVKTRDKQLEELQKSAGASEELQKQIETLTQQNKDQKAAYDKELAAVKVMAAVDAELTAAGAKNITAVKAVLADFLKDAKIVDGKVLSKEGTEAVTLAAKVEALKKDATTDFLFGAAPKYTGWKPGEGGDGGGKPGGGKKPSEMSYTELAAYLEANPDAKLDD
ncbi:MAG: phage scaffolding protein [Ruminococcus flavefaciens]|nr:phage scaffolding protein [Ruminococcus flavefaciens]